MLQQKKEQRKKLDNGKKKALTGEKTAMTWANREKGKIPGSKRRENCPSSRASEKLFRQ
jgi:hypothetical protein